MFIFLIPVTHHLNADDYDNTWRLLDHTLHSVTSQTCDEFHVMVACSKVMPLHICSRIDKVTFIECADHIICESQPSQTGKEYDLHILDKSIKRKKLIQESSWLSPSLFMMMDADDFVHKDLVRYAFGNSLQAITVLNKGWAIHKKRSHYIENMTAYCGSTVIAKPCFLKDILDSHKHLGDHQLYRSCQHEVPFPSIVYNIHAANHSCYLSKYNKRWKYESELTSKIMSDFNMLQEHLD